MRSLLIMIVLSLIPSLVNAQQSGTVHPEPDPVYQLPTDDPIVLPDEAYDPDFFLPEVLQDEPVDEIDLSDPPTSGGNLDGLLEAIMELLPTLEDIFGSSGSGDTGGTPSDGGGPLDVELGNLADQTEDAPELIHD